MGVPGPVRVRSSFCSLVSTTCLLRDRRCANSAPLYRGLADNICPPLVYPFRFGREGRNRNHANEVSEMPFVEHGSVRIRYEEGGNASGYPLLLLAPGGMNSGLINWSKLAA